MIRIFIAATVSAFVLLNASCCCTGEPKAPGLRPLPKFSEVQTPEVSYTK
ncbi:MAG: hypothetical protein HC845_02840 [Akkermansiaceae bacterium]|nr:hypothetical protein [Akkermansiaceae bacterium]